jgi:hypothetical protein
MAEAVEHANAARVRDDRVNGATGRPA